MKKVLIMLSSMNIGGVEKSLLSLLSVISKKNYDVTLYLLEKKGGFLDQVPDDVKVVEAAWYRELKPVVMQPPQVTARDYFRQRRWLKLLFFLVCYVISKQTGNRWIYYSHVFQSVPMHSESYDIAVAYQGPTDMIDFYVAQKVRADEKISWVHFDVSEHRINAKLYRKLYRSFHRIMAVSEAARQRLLERIPGIEHKTQVFPNIVPHQLVAERSREAVPFDDRFDGIRLVTVGRLSPEKGQDLAVEALAMLVKEGYDVKWYCIGEGKGRTRYEQLAKQYGVQDRFILLGAKTNPYPYMAKADVYVQTSRHEGYCLTLAEARILCKPIVTTDVIGAYEQIEHGRTGYIVACRAAELYEAIKYLIDHPEERQRLNDNLRKDIERKGVSPFERSHPQPVHAL